MIIKNSGKWEADAGNISDFNQLDRFVYLNGSVESFLNDDGKSFVIAAKGIGKTLLLSYKRYLFENKYGNENSQSLVFIPNLHPYISFVESIKTTLTNEHLNCLRNWEYCSKLWALIIELCVISYSDLDKKELANNIPTKAKRHKDYIYDLVKENNSIEYIFNELISLNETTLTRLINHISNYIGKQFSRVHQGMIIFFDRLDNALETSHTEIWTPIQAGLLEGAWNVMRSNHHVKIYLSIRQEAYAAHRSRNMNAISTSVVEIAYNKNELKELVNHLVQYYEQCDTLEDFLEFDSFPNTVIYKDENVFDFMYRYSIGRPRDFVQFCGALSKHKDSYHDLNTKRMELKKIIRETSSATIINNLYEELAMLLKCLNTIECFNDFLVLIKHNILTYTDLQDICSKYNHINCNRDCESCIASRHPFCDLHNMGLLGTVVESPDGNGWRQKFKSPYENFTYGLRGDVKFFLIHPALREYINTQHRSSSIGTKYELYDGILVGNDIEWTQEFTKRYYLNKWVNQIKNDEARTYYKELLRNYIEGKSIEPIRLRYPGLIELPLFEKPIITSLTQTLSKGTIIMPKPISIFVSYAYDSKDHARKVESFVELLRNMGFDAKMDVMLRDDYPNLDQLMTYGLQSDKIIVVLSPEYKRKADNSIGGVWKEFIMIANDLENNPKKYIFVSFDSFNEALKQKVSPTRIGNRWIVDLDKGRQDGYNELISFIKEEKEYPFSKVNPNTVSTKPKTILPF